MQTNLVVVTAFVEDISPLSNYGAEKILIGKSEALNAKTETILNAQNTNFQNMTTSWKNGCFEFV